MCSFLNALGMAEIRLLFRTGAGKVRQAIVERCGPLAGESFYSRVRTSRPQDVVLGVRRFGGFQNAGYVPSAWCVHKRWICAFVG